MRDSDPTATFEADRKEIEGFLSRSTQLESQSTPQLEVMECILNQSSPHLEAGEGFPRQSAPQLEANEGFPSPRTPKLQIDDDMLLGRGARWLRGCAESSNPLLLEHCKALQEGRCAY
jgi:hypothetical protein